MAPGRTDRFDPRPLPALAGRTAEGMACRSGARLHPRPHVATDMPADITPEGHAEGVAGPPARFAALLE